MKNSPESSRYPVAPVRTFESPVFPSEVENRLFIEWLSKNTYMNMVSEDRASFVARKGNIIIPSASSKMSTKQLSYTLYIPNDLKIAELPAIIRRINRITFGDMVPNTASTLEMQTKIISVVDRLMKKISQTKNPSDSQAINKALKKYILLYTDLTSPEEAQKLSNTEYRNQYLSSISSEKYNTIQKKLILTDIKAKITNLYDDVSSVLPGGSIQNSYEVSWSTKQHLDEIESHISGELIEHLDESVFEYGTDMIRQGLHTITQAEQTSIYNRALQDGFIPSVHNPNLLLKGEEEIELQHETTNLTQAEELLRVAIHIDEYKTRLSLARNKGTLYDIALIEYEASSAIAREIHKYPYRHLKSNAGYTPIGILENKEVYCVGFSLIAHALLSELGIQHQGLDIPNHSAISVNIGNVDYILDGTSNGDIFPYTYVLPQSGSGVYGTIKARGYSERAQRGDPETILQGHIYNNLGDTLDNQKKYPEAILAYQKAIELNPKAAIPYNNLGNALSQQKKYPEAIGAYQKAIELDPKYATPYNGLGCVLDDQQKYPEAIGAFQKAIELDPKYANPYNNLGTTLSKQQKYPEAILAHQKAIELNPKDARLYYNLGNTLFEQKKYPEAILAYQKAIELDPKDAKLYHNLGSALFEQKKYPEAIGAFQKSIELAPKYVMPYKGLGIVLQKIHKSPELGNFVLYIADLIAGTLQMKDISSLKTNYKKDLEIAGEYISRQDYIGLRIYSLSIIDTELKK